MQIDALRMHCQGWGVYGQMPAPLGGSSTGTHKGKFIGWLRGGEEIFGHLPTPPNLITKCQHMLE